MTYRFKHSKLRVPNGANARLMRTCHIRPYRRSGIFSPGDLFANGEEGGYYSFDPHTVFQDQGTVPATPGDPVGTVFDLSGNAHSFEQLTHTQKPIYTRHPKSGVDLDIDEPDYSGNQIKTNDYDITEPGVPDCYGLTFDGIDDALESAATIDLTGTDNASMAIGMRIGKFDEINQQYLVHNKDISPYLVMHYFWAETKYLIKSDTDIGGAGVEHGNVIEPVAQIARFAPGDIDLLVNGVEADKPTSGQNGNLGDGYLNLARRDGTFAFTEMVCYSALLIDRAITDEERTQLQTYLINNTAGASL